MLEGGGGNTARRPVLPTLSGLNIRKRTKNRRTRIYLPRLSYTLHNPLRFVRLRVDLTGLRMRNVRPTAGVVEKKIKCIYVRWWKKHVLISAIFPVRFNDEIIALQAGATHHILFFLSGVIIFLGVICACGG